MKAFSMPTIRTYLYSCESMVQVSSTDFVAKFGELTSFFKMKSDNPVSIQFEKNTRLQNFCLLLVGKVILMSWIKCVLKTKLSHFRLHRLSRFISLFI